jgi:3-hydroxyacyl-[acyl-carrier-protein] dehydratase
MSDAVEPYRAQLRVLAGHPSFPGHFPGHPILPGVLLLQRVMSLAETSFDIPLAGCRLNNIKFLSPVAPGDEIDVQLAELNIGDYRFTVHVVQPGAVADVLACSGQLHLAQPATSSV